MTVGPPVVFMLPSLPYVHAPGPDTGSFCRLIGATPLDRIYRSLTEGRLGAPDAGGLRSRVERLCGLCELCV